ncbi:C45 family autoproteolytic acyltransferase/hydolase [Streptomyces sp. NPDC001816]|uniref:C45 family autoproteolytic acyltransferase/hydolase n=1 Tax=Streptomyces sp. NPDC001816 TaxID=3364612 RepID=UPI0036C80DBC
MSTTTFIRAAGAPREIGRAHGAVIAAPLRAFLDDGLTRLNHLTAEPLSLPELLPSIAVYRAEITAQLPDLAEEVAGLAEGAGITEDEAWLLQLRREVMGYSGVPAAGDCTTYARVAAGGPPVLAQTVDQNANLDRNISVVHVDRAGSPRRVLVLSFAGLLCFMGLNSDGLAIGLNLVTDGEWRPGVPPYLAIRHLLDSAGSVDEALEILAGLDLSSSRNMMLCDREKVVFAEFQQGRLRVTEPAQRWAVHANHYLHPDFIPQDRQTAFDRISSDARTAAATEGLAALAPDAGPEEHFALLCKAPLCIADRGDITLERTVAAVVLLPAAGEMHLRPGDPNLALTQVFRV